MAECLQARGVTVRRGRHTLLDAVDARFEAGRVNVLLGPNGAGKSTLLRVLTGVLSPDAGTVHFGGVALARLSPGALARRRAVLAQESTLQFDFTVAEVVLLGRIPHLSGWEAPRDHEACERALAAMELEAFRNRRYTTLSGGEKQRVQLARVLAQLDPAGTSSSEQRWLFLDEPTSALDLRHQHTTLALAQRLAGASGLGVVAVLHDLNLALRYADHALLLSAGRVAAEGAPADVLEPARIEAVYGVCAEALPGVDGRSTFLNVTHTPLRTSP